MSEQSRTQRSRRHIPFDVFAMPVDVSVSSMVCDADFGWTCGQCPLDLKGEVVFPGNLLAQADRVCEMIEELISRGGYNIAALGKLEIYFVNQNAGDADALIALFTERFPHQPILVPIPVPHFYYDGLMIEVDAFVGVDATAKPIENVDGVSLDVVSAGSLAWVSARVQLSGSETLQGVMKSLGNELKSAGFTPDMLLSDHWFLAAGTESPLHKLSRVSEWITHPEAFVKTPISGDQSLTADLTFTIDAHPVQISRSEDEALRITRRTGAGFSWVSGVFADAQRNLVDQTQAIMAGIEGFLATDDLAFEDVVKLTARYVGGASPEELHGNMTVRHEYYSEPGPASTGLPVLALSDPRCRIAIDVLARRTD